MLSNEHTKSMNEIVMKPNNIIIDKDDDCPNSDRKKQARYSPYAHPAQLVYNDSYSSSKSKSASQLMQNLEKQAAFSPY